jgi:hypothetical protein
MSPQRHIRRHEPMNDCVPAARRLARLLKLLAAALLVACAGPPPERVAPDLPQPRLRLGDPVELLHAPTVRDKVHAVAGRDGVMHVAIASTNLQQVIEVSATRDGALGRRIVREQASPARLDAAFDASGQLHLLLDAEHMVLQGEAWQRSERTPWEAAGVKAQAPRFAQGAPDLTWAFQVQGLDVGAPQRVDLMGFGGSAGGLVWPWFTRGTRAVVVAQVDGGYGPWIVIDPDGKEDTKTLRFVADGDGTAYLLYERSRGGLAAEPSLNYVRLANDVLKRAPAPGSAATSPAQRMPPIEPVHGRAVPGKVVLRAQPPAAVHVIPAPEHRYTEVATCECSGIVHALTFGEARDQWFGKGRPVRYAVFDGERWSAPIEVGTADVSSFWGWVWDAAAIACTSRGDVFVVWPTEQAIMGRWLEPVP